MDYKKVTVKEFAKLIDEVLEGKKESLDFFETYDEETDNVAFGNGIQLLELFDGEYLAVGYYGGGKAKLYDTCENDSFSLAKMIKQDFMEGEPFFYIDNITTQ